jgi:hypothetical protein
MDINRSKQAKRANEDYDLYSLDVFMLGRGIERAASVLKLPRRSLSTPTFA